MAVNLKNIYALSDIRHHGTLRKTNYCVLESGFLHSVRLFQCLGLGRFNTSVTGHRHFIDYGIVFFCQKSCTSGLNYKIK